MVRQELSVGGTAMVSGLVQDLITYLTNPVPRHLRKMDYPRELRNLESRRKRCKAAWQSHLANTQSLILKAADNCPGSEKALIIGSGPLFDIPIAELSGQFQEVVLVDILHPWKSRYYTKCLPNVRLEQLDVTGVVENVFALPRSRQSLEMLSCKPGYFLHEGFDMIISANVLSQLPVIPNTYASNQIKGLKLEQMRIFSQRMVINHLDWLASFRGKVCLIADVERLKCDGPKIISREDSLWGVHLPHGGREWFWDLAPRPEIDIHFDIRHQVVGYPEFPKNIWLDRKIATAKRTQ